RRDLQFDRSVVGHGRDVVGIAPRRAGEPRTPADELDRRTVVIPPHSKRAAAAAAAHAEPEHQNKGQVSGHLDVLLKARTTSMVVCRTAPTGPRTASGRFASR